MPSVWQTPTAVNVQSGAVGWVTEAEFVSYCNTKHVNADAYTQTGNNVQALNYALMCIVTNPEIKLPEDGTVTNWMQFAQMEQALYLLQQSTARDMRLGLIAQGVTRADIVGEYLKAQRRIDLCAGAAMFLSPYTLSNGGGWGKIVGVAPR